LTIGSGYETNGDDENIKQSEQRENEHELANDNSGFLDGNNNGAFVGAIRLSRSVWQHR
jgi:hypothetical protein